MSLSPDQLGKPLKISKRVRETEDAVSLVLDIPADLKSKFEYQAGQFVTFFMKINGEDISRSYSLSSSPVVDDEFKITVKKVPGGKGSTYLCDQVREGDSLLTTPPAGHFFKPSAHPKGTHYFLFAAGSGITPVFSILKTVLTASALNRVTLVYCNRFEHAIIFDRDLKYWAEKHPTRFDLVQLISKPSDAWGGRSGRLSPELIAELIETPNVEGSAREYFLCGPTAFMDTISDALGRAGVARDQVRREDFAITVPKEHVPVDEGWTVIGDDAAGGPPEKIVAELNGETVEVAAKEGQSVLETLLEAGQDAPYSCMNGTCMACLAKVIEGRVYQEDPGILTDDNITNGEMLTCQAKPLSRLLRLSYDAL